MKIARHQRFADLGAPHNVGVRSLRRSTSGGQAATEYLIAVSVLSLALAVGPDSPLQQVFEAISLRYASFTHAISRP